MRRPVDGTALQPHHLETFLSRVIETAQKTKRFEREWRSLVQMIPHVRAAWEQGKALFQQDLARYANNAEDMEELSTIDLAVDYYVTITARETYPHDQALQNWAINGYMLAWRQHFLKEKSIAYHQGRRSFSRRRSGI